MATKLMTPGVYIVEKDSFPGSVVAVETAVPAFIGYTEKAMRNGKDLKDKPVRITSLQEYMELFGGAFPAKFELKKSEEVADKTKPRTTINGTDYVIDYIDKNKAFMFPNIKLFFANGGGACYIVSVGTYANKSSVEPDREELLGTKTNGGLKALEKEQEPTLIVVPDAVNLGDDCYTLYQTVLKHCNNMQSRVAILDVHDGYQNRIRGNADVDIITKFREKIGSENLNYAAAYYPWLHTNINQKKDVTFKNLNVDLKTLATYLPEENAKQMIAGFPDEAKIKEQLATEKATELEEAKKADGKPEPIVKVTNPGEFTKTSPVYDGDEDDEAAKAAHQKLVDAFEIEKATHDQAVIEHAKYIKVIAETRLNYPDLAEDADEDAVIAAVTAAITKFDEAFTANSSANTFKNYNNLLKSFTENKERNLHLGLVATSPTYSDLQGEICEVMNLLPPSSAMAGIYTMVDVNRGVWKSPANVSVTNVIKPAANITHEEQENLNVDAISGKSINAIRTFPGVGTMVWGGRTLDGNSLDWRYINVRRTMIMLEQSIKLALRSYVFEPNDANTWVTVKSMIVNFLTEKWKQGALAGSSPEDAFSVNIGLGSTMTSLDILEGKMLVSVKLAIVRPAEFIVVTFEQQMQKS